MLWIGRRMSVGIGLESTRGVGVAPTYWLNTLSFSFNDVVDRALSEAATGERMANTALAQHQGGTAFRRERARRAEIRSKNF